MSRITRDLSDLVLGARSFPATAPRPPAFLAPLLRRCQRHPLPIAAHFRHSLVLTYAFPPEALEPLLPPGLVLDTYENKGFLAIAMVQTENLRPTFCPQLFGKNFFLTGYRIFVRYRNQNGRWLRGLRILRSDTNRRSMAFFGNLLTHYHYQRANVVLQEVNKKLSIDIQTPSHGADLSLTADLNHPPAELPAGSPFKNWHQARLFAGPLPFTFDYEPETNSIVLIEGVRSHWNPQPVAVDITRNSFFDHEPFNRFQPVLANAFHVADIDYRWKPGVVETLAQPYPSRKTPIPHPA